MTGDDQAAPNTAAAQDTTPYTAEITTTPCPRCQATVVGVNGRYACNFCGWCSPYVPPETTPVCTPCRDGCTAHPSAPS